MKNQLSLDKRAAPFYYSCVSNNNRDPINPGPLDKAVSFRIYRTARRLRTHLAQFLAKIEFPAGAEHWFILYRLYENNSLQQGELADKSLDDRANISRHIKTLEKLGLVSRMTDPNDSRVKRIALSRKGRNSMQKVFVEVEKERKRIFGNIAKTDLAVFLKTLERIEKKL